MDLYHFPVSPYSHKAQMALIEKDISYTARPVMLFDPEQCRQYREIHPIGKLPLLDIDGTHIPESSIIVEYLDQHFDGPKFLPESNEEALQVRLKDRWIDQYLSDPMITIFFQMMKPETQRDMQRIEKCQHYIRSTYVFIEQSLANKKDDALYAHGDNWTLADLALVPSLRVAHNILPFDSYPVITRYFARHQQRESLQIVTKEADEIFAQFVEALRK